jgi:hypothetical protein
MKTYTIGKRYTVHPFNLDKYDAEFVGYIGDNYSDPMQAFCFPVFKFPFFWSPPGEPKAIALVALHNGRWLAGGKTVEELMTELTRRLSYRGTEYQSIRISGDEGGGSLSRDEYVRQATEAGVSQADIDAALLRGRHFDTTHGKSGWTKYCPTCKRLRDTSCSACGCGSCKTCDHRWCCNPTPLEPLTVTPGTFAFPPLLRPDSL